MILKSSVLASRGDINLVHVGNYIFYDVNHIQESQAREDLSKSQMIVLNICLN